MFDCDSHCGFHLQLVVEAYDSRFPLNRTQATVFITVRRGARGVSFQPSATYEARVTSCDPSTGSIIQTVRATTEDGNSVRHMTNFTLFLGPQFVYTHICNTKFY